MLAPKKEPGKNYKPSKITTPFTAEEIRKAAKKMKNGKSARPDKLEIEFIKYAPLEIHQEIASIFQHTNKYGRRTEGADVWTTTTITKTR